MFTFNRFIVDKNRSHQTNNTEKRVEVNDLKNKSNLNRQELEDNNDNEEKEYDDCLNELLATESTRIQDDNIDPMLGEFNKEMIIYNQKFKNLTKELTENNMIIDVLTKLSKEEEESGKTLIQQSEEFLQSITRKANRLQEKHKRLDLKLNELKGNLK